jgi:hypothetical protein
MLANRDVLSAYMLTCICTGYLYVSNIIITEIDVVKTLVYGPKQGDIDLLNAKDISTGSQAEGVGIMIAHESIRCNNDVLCVDRTRTVHDGLIKPIPRSKRLVAFPSPYHEGFVRLFHQHPKSFTLLPIDNDVGLSSEKVDANVSSRSSHYV